MVLSFLSHVAPPSPSATYTHTHTLTPLHYTTLHTATDRSIGNIYGASDAAGINRYGYNLTIAVRKIMSDKTGIILGKGARADVHRGGFLDSCFRHTTGVTVWEGAVRDSQHRSPSQVFAVWYVITHQR